MHFRTLNIGLKYDLKIKVHDILYLLLLHITMIILLLNIILLLYF